MPPFPPVTSTTRSSSTPRPVPDSEVMVIRQYYHSALVHRAAIVPRHATYTTRSLRTVVHMTRRPPGRPRAEEAPFSADELLLAALQSFADHGYDGMSVRALGERLGVSHNLISQKFGSKEQLWRKAVDRYFGAVTDDLDQLLPADDANCEELVAAFRSSTIRFIVANAERPELLRLMNVEASIDSPRLDYLYGRYIGPSARRLGALYGRMVACGVVAELPTGTMFYLLAHGASAPASHSALSRKLGISDPSDPTVARAHAEAVTDAILYGISRGGEGASNSTAAKRSRDRAKG